MAEFIDLVGNISSVSDGSATINAALFISIVGASDSVSNGVAVTDIIESPDTELLGSLVYTEGLDNMLTGQIDFSTADFKIMLLNNNYAPDTSHSYHDIVNFGAEISGVGYTLGGKTVEGVTIKDGILYADNLRWYNATFTSVRWALLYVDNGTEETNQVVGVFDFGTNRTIDAGIFSVLWGIAGNGSYGEVLQMTQKIPASQKFTTT